MQYFVGGSGEGRNYDVAPDGSRFLMHKQVASGPGQIRVITNWAEELNRLLP